MAAPTYYNSYEWETHKSKSLPQNNSEDTTINNFLPSTKIQSSVKPLSETAFKAWEEEKCEKLNALLAKNKKPFVNLLTCGHVDAGKSTLLGHLLANLGQVNKSTMHKIDKKSKEENKMSYRYAWVLDSSKAERDHGVTVNVGVAHFETSSRKFLLMDCPGHKDFVPNMLAEVSSADAALLVVDCSEGNFERGFSDDGQTKEHVLLVRSFGVTTLIVALNKMDTIHWNRERVSEVTKRLDGFLSAQNFEFISYIPVSGLTGDNLTENYYACDWYNGPSILDALNSIGPFKSKYFKPTRFCISAVDHSYQFGNVFFGKIVSGAISVGERLLAMPINFMILVKSLIVNGESFEMAVAGENVEVAFSSDKDLLKVGNVVCCPNDPVPVVKLFSAKILTLKLELPILQEEELVMHVHNEELIVKLKKVKSSKNRRDGKISAKKNLRFVSSVSDSVVLLEAERPLCVDNAKENGALGRFVLRKDNKTIAIGVVTDLVEGW